MNRKYSAYRAGTFHGLKHPLGSQNRSPEDRGTDVITRADPLQKKILSTFPITLRQPPKTRPVQPLTSPCTTKCIPTRGMKRGQMPSPAVPARSHPNPQQWYKWTLAHTVMQTQRRLGRRQPGAPQHQASLSVGMVPKVIHNPGTELRGRRCTWLHPSGRVSMTVIIRCPCHLKRSS
jgi:hypothetical protein